MFIFFLTQQQLEFGERGCRDLRWPAALEGLGREGGTAVVAS
jgi:hypothetical protein